MPNLLVEIGTEELPLGSLDVIYGHLQSSAESLLKDSRLTFSSVLVEATPRRTALYIADLPKRQSDQNLEIKGPSEEKAFKDGKPTPALEGFLRSKRARLEDIQIVDSPKGRLVVMRQMEKGKTLQAALPGVLSAVFAALPFPKLMRWEASGFRFPRPVRWIAALLDDKVLPFELCGIKAGKKTYGHRFLAPAAVLIPSADWKAYQMLLKKAHIMLGLSDRQQKIREELKQKFSQTRFDEELVHITAQLAEEPFLIEGGFEKHYLHLPADVLSTCMKKNQKIFACYNGQGKLVNKFVAVLNGKRNGLDRVRFDYENVLESRLKDARYFYDADLKKHLADRLADLGQIAYLGKLGTMKDKTERLEKLSSVYAKSAGLEKETAKLARAAYLSKTDLMTHLVYEFPNLQGIVGGEYAAKLGEDEEVSRAIGTHYLPRNLGESFEQAKREMTVLGALLGVMDRIDLLTGSFATGLEPTGSQDPYALRRAGGSIVKILRAFGFSFSLSSILLETLRLYENSGLKMDPGAAQALIDKLKVFFKDRVIFELQLKSGTRNYEIFEAVWQSGSENIADVFERFESLAKFYATDPDTFMKAGKVVERTSNITKGFGKGDTPVDPALLSEPLEKELFSLLEMNSEALSRKVESRQFGEATRHFGEVFYVPVHDFFEKVMVNVPDEKIRRNRQALMTRINRLYTDRLADLSLLSKMES